MELEKTVLSEISYIQTQSIYPLSHVKVKFFLAVCGILRLRVIGEAGNGGKLHIRYQNTEERSSVT